jgi:hypothetical protein
MPNWLAGLIVVLMIIVFAAVAIAAVAMGKIPMKSRQERMVVGKPVKPPTPQPPQPPPDPQKAFVPCRSPPNNQSAEECFKHCTVLSSIYGGDFQTVDTQATNPDGTPGAFNWLGGTNYRWGCYDPAIRF